MRISAALAFALAAPATGQVPASEKADAMALVHQFIDGFNKGDLKSATSARAHEASVIDDFPPHECKAGAAKSDGFRAIAKKAGITDAKILPGEPQHVDGEWA